MPRIRLGPRKRHGLMVARTMTNLAREPRATQYTAGGLGVFDNGRWGANTTYTTRSPDGPPDPDLTTYVRGTLTAATTGPGFHLASNPEQATPDATQAIAVTPGQALSIAVWWRHSLSSNARLGWRFQVGSTSWVAATQVVDANPSAANVWTRLSSGPVVVPATSTHVSLYVISNQAQAIGYTFDATGLLIVDQDPGFHVDGDSPGWKWSGTAPHSSSSGPVFSL